jgi:hypothetical protein
MAVRWLLLVLALVAPLGAAELDDHAKFVERLAKSEPDRDRRIIKWAMERLGTPYKLDAQGEGDGKDADPLWSTKGADCTILVLQAAAMADAATPSELLAGMLMANYRNGRAKFEERYHYSEDRIRSSPLFEDITAEVFPAKDLVKESITLNRKPDGSLSMQDVAWERPLELVYRPTASLTSAHIAKLPKVCGVMFVKRQNRKLGLLVGHEGIVVHGRVLIHASSKQKRVAMEPFVPYSRTRDGIVVFRFKERPGAAP